MRVVAPRRCPAGPPLTISEDEFQTTVIALARLFGWRIVHIRPLPDPRRPGKWTTPYEGDPGLPDLILARDGVVLLIELKSQQGKATLGQRAWLTAAGGNGRLWKPSDWPEVYDTLRRAA